MLKIILVVTVTWVPFGHVDEEKKELKFWALSPWRSVQECREHWADSKKEEFEKFKMMANDAGMPYRYEAKCIVEVME